MNTTTKVPLDKFGPPGTAGQLVVLDVIPGDTRSKGSRLRDDRKRPFEVSAILRKDALHDTNINLSVDVEQGSSYVLAEAEALESYITVRGQRLTLAHNSNRELSKLSYPCEATCGADALAQFHAIIGPILDHISFSADVPMHLTRTEWFDRNNQVRGYNYGAPYPSVRLPHESQIVHRVEPLYALYREAKNAASPFYRFLCYYKILEGTYDHLRPDLFKRAKASGKAISTEKEQVPDHSELRLTHKDLIGAPINKIFNERFRKQFRDEVAHYLLDDGGVLKVSDHATAHRFESEILVVELCARVVIGVQERYERQLA